ncbi:MAG: methyltransferase domain-containing protein [Candidatus Nanoarchaeia archaeon]|nr:methyltransferase domain-containing protein [Candidatus Nanoarchaeia archaeon]
MQKFNETVKITSYTIESVKEKDLGLKIYRKMVEDLNGFLKVDEGYKMETMDMFASESYLKESKPDWMNYKSMDSLATFVRNDENQIVDIVADPNNIPVNPRTFDAVFTVGSRFGYGQNHMSLPEICRILKPGGLLIVALSKYWFYHEFSQLLLSYSFKYLRAIEICYSIVESKIASAKYFTFSRFKG